MTRRYPAAAFGFVSLLVFVLLPGGARAEELNFDTHTWTKYSSGFTPIAVGTPAATYSFDQSACGERYVGTAGITAPQTVSGTVVGNEFIPTAPLVISATFKLKYTAAPRNPPSDPAAAYYLRIETRDVNSGALKCRRQTDFINVNAGTHDLSFDAECSVDRAGLSFGMMTTLRTEFAITTGNQTGICGYTIYAETQFSLPAPTDLSVSVVDPNCATTTDCLSEYIEPDPATSFATMRLVQDPAELTKAGVVRTGVVADGVTELLLHATLPESTAAGTTVTFQLLDVSGTAVDSRWGVLMRRDGSGAASSITVPADYVSGGKRRAFALYRAPLDHPAPGAVDSTQFTIRAASSAKPSELVNKRLKLLPPPVVLVHGVWSDRSAWAGLEPELKNAGFRVCADCRPDYGTYDPAPNFDPLEVHSPESRYVSNVVIAGINAALKDDRKNGIAVTQVDGVGHSMGGVVLRARMAIPRNGTFRDPYRLENYLKGDLHKIITVGTPHKGSTLVNWLIEHQCDTVQLRALNPPTIADAMAWLGKPIKGAIYGFQTASYPLRNVGRTPVPGHAVIGIAPPDSQTEEALKTLVRLNTSRDPQGQPWNFDAIGGGEGKHDTIVNDYSQYGGIVVPYAFSVVPGIVHADITQKNDVGETESPVVWQKVIQLLRDRVDQSFTIFQQHDPDPKAPILGECTSGASLQAVAPSAISATITPAAGTVVRPGATVMVGLTATGAKPVEGALFIAGSQAEVINGAGPFSISWVVPVKKAGRVDVRVATFGSVNENYGGETYVLVQPLQAPASLSVTPSEGSLVRRDERIQLVATASYPDATSLDVTSGTAGTTYTTLSGGTAVLRVSADGTVTPVATGSDSVVVTNNGKSVTVPISVRIDLHRRAVRSGG